MLLELWLLFYASFRAPFFNLFLHGQQLINIEHIVLMFIKLYG